MVRKRLCCPGVCPSLQCMAFPSLLLITLRLSLQQKEGETCDAQHLPGGRDTLGGPSQAKSGLGADFQTGQGALGGTSSSWGSSCPSSSRQGEAQLCVWDPKPWPFTSAWS